VHTWKAIWEKKGQVELPTDTAGVYATLMEVNAWKTVLGDMTPAELVDAANAIGRSLHLEPHQTLLDVGCGCGAVLYALGRKPARMIGVDYSASSIALARQLVDAELHCAEAAALPVASGSVDAAFSAGVFQYFPSLDYAGAVIEEMVRVLKPGGFGLLIDLMDLDCRERCERARRGTMSEAEYRQRYAGLEHLYIGRQWLFERLERLGCTAELHDVYSEDYCYRDYMFHVRFEKRSAA